MTRLAPRSLPTIIVAMPSIVPLQLYMVKVGPNGKIDRLKDPLVAKDYAHIFGLCTYLEGTR